MKDLYFLLAGLAGIALGVIIMIIVAKLGFLRATQKSKLVIDEANSKAESIVRQAQLEGKTQSYELKLATEKEIKELRSSLHDEEIKLNRREEALSFRDEQFTQKEKQLDNQNKQVSSKLEQLAKMEEQLKINVDGQLKELERIASISAHEAKEEIFEIVKHRSSNEIEAYIRDQEDEAKSKAADTAREIIGMAISRYAQEETLERTVSVVNLPNEDMKGRIIGREGRNIRAIEQATGVDILIDDTPETITLSCFNPIRREIARQTLEILLKDGRIQPGRIEEVTARVEAELDEQIIKYGEDAIFKLGIGKMDRELIKLLGRMRFRYSYGQNALQHSMEVASLCGMMAVELGLNQGLAKRVGLLHDIGKALDFEMEGSHIELGARVCRKHGEHPYVINGIESHHGDKPADNVYSILAGAADTLSAARPGARFENFENYIQRLEKLEEIANSFEGVEKTYAIQAGREIRVMVTPEKIDDLNSHRIAREIREKIENEMTYPGQIKVTVIRETRHQEIAK